MLSPKVFFIMAKLTVFIYRCSGTFTPLLSFRILFIVAELTVFISRRSSTYTLLLDPNPLFIITGLVIFICNCSGTLTLLLGPRVFFIIATKSAVFSICRLYSSSFKLFLGVTATTAVQSLESKGVITESRGVTSF